MALVGVAAADTTWSFDGNLSTTGTSIGTTAHQRVATTNEETGNVTYSKGNATAVYTESGLTMGDSIGKYTLTANLGKAVDLRSTTTGGYTWLTQNSVHYTSTNGGNNTNYFALTSTVTENGTTTVTQGTDFTIMAYVNFDNVSGEQFIFGTSNAVSNGLAFGLNNGKLDLLAKYVDHHDLTNGPTILADTWYLLAVSYDSTLDTATFYVNGDNVGSITLGKKFNLPTGGVGGAIGAGTQDLVENAGAIIPQGVVDAQIAELKVFNSALSQSQILTQAHLVPEPTTATLSLLALCGLAARRRRK